MRETSTGQGWREVVVHMLKGQVTDIRDQQNQLSNAKVGGMCVVLPKSFISLLYEPTWQPSGLLSGLTGAGGDGSLGKTLVQM